MTEDALPDDQTEIADHIVPFEIGSPSYLERLRTASAKELPPEDLARDYRHIVGQEEPDLKLST